MKLTMSMSVKPTLKQDLLRYFKVETDDATHYFAARDWGVMKIFIQSPVFHPSDEEESEWTEKNLRQIELESARAAPFFGNLEKNDFELASDNLYSLGVVSKKTIQARFRW